MAYSWNSELPSGRNPFWIRDEALAGLGLHAGDAVSVDTCANPCDGDLVVAEVDLDGDPLRLARRYFARDDEIRLEGVGASVEPIETSAENVMVLGVVVGRLRFRPEPVEEPLEQ
jgi:SOS-response transcriptional repressor LexA